MSYLNNFEQNYILGICLSMFSYMCVNGQGWDSLVTEHTWDRQTGTLNLERRTDDDKLIVSWMQIFARDIISSLKQLMVWEHSALNILLSLSCNLLLQLLFYVLHQLSVLVQYHVTVLCIVWYLSSIGEQIDQMGMMWI